MSVVSILLLACRLFQSGPIVSYVLLLLSLLRLLLLLLFLLLLLLLPSMPVEGEEEGAEDQTGL